MEHKLIVLLFCMCMAAVPYPCLGQTVQGPKILIEEPEFDFHKADEGQVVSHDFVVRNLGNQPLEITRVAPG
ncbi:MAG: DUF1573 domain-containing protein [Desulfobacteraceae bacterium]|jgi:hypothetical protein